MPERVVYTGHFVEESDKLLAQIPPMITGEGSKLYAHHVTNEFKPANGKEGIIPGRRRTLHAIGQVAAGGVHAILVVDSEGGKISANEHPHITIATAEGISPVASNQVIADAKETGTVIPIEPPVPIPVVEGYFDGRQVHTS